LPHTHVRENPALYAKLSRELPPAAVFDLDMTIFDNSQRFKDARRAGLVDKEGKAVSKGMMSKGQAWRKRNNFLYSKKNLRKDTVIPGAKELVNELANEGYTIVYLTARPKEHYEATIEQLEYFGFPLFRDNKGETLLIMKERMNAQVGAYKGNALRELSGNYKVEMFFDDDNRALEEAIKLKIPGVYSTVDQRTNPGAGDVYIPKEDIEEAYRMMPDPDDEDDRTVGETMNPSDTDGYREAAGTIITKGDKVLLLRRSVKETSRHGMWELPGGKLEEGETPEDAALTETKEESGLDVVINKKVGEHVDHNMNKVYHAYIAEPTSVDQEVKLSEEHDESQWMTIEEALALEEGKLSHHAKFFFAKMKVLSNPRKNPEEIRRNFLGFGKAAQKKKEKKSQDAQMREYKNFLQKHWQGEPFEFYLGEKWPNWKELNPDSHPNAVFSSSQIGAGNSLLIYNHATAHAKKSHDFKRVMKEQKAAIKKIPTGYKPKPKGITIYVDRELSLEFHSKETIKAINIAKKLFKESDLKILEMPGIYSHGLEATMSALFGEDSMRPDKKKTKGDIKAEKIHAAIHSKDFAAQGGWPLVVVDGWKIGGLDHLKAWSKSEMSNKYKKAKAKTNPRIKTNPANPTKVKKAEKLYQHMNGQEPDKVQTEMIDIGDVWYKVGEGGAWQIGYMSGKETGKEEQKYLHTFNEESKDGNFPELYATMPDKGKPMLIIRGGTWKIKTDDKGVAWIYD